MTKEPLLEWVEAKVTTRYRTMRSLAKAIGRTQSALKRGLMAGTVGIDTVLLLARETGESPGRLLSLAGKSDVDALIRGLYGSERPILPADVQVVVDFLQAPDESLKEAQRGMVALAKGMRAPSPSHELTLVRPAGQPSGGIRTRAKRGTRRE